MLENKLGITNADKIYFYGHLESLNQSINICLKMFIPLPERFAP